MRHETYLVGELAVSPALTADDQIILCNFGMHCPFPTITGEPLKPTDSPFWPGTSEGGLVHPLEVSLDGARLSVAAHFPETDYFANWIEDVISSFFAPRKYSLSGRVHWVGGGLDDRGTVYIRDNSIEDVKDVLHNPGPSWEPNPYVSDGFLGLTRALVLSADAAGCSDDLTVVSAETLRPFQRLLRPTDGMALTAAEVCQRT